MGRCSNNKLASKIQYNTYDKQTEIFINVLKDIETCDRIVTANYVGLNPVGATATFDMYAYPEDAFQCNASGCTNSGTLEVSYTTEDEETPPEAGATFLGLYDATEFFGGVVTYYVKFDEAGTYTLDTTFADRQYVDAIAAGTPSVPSDTYTRTITVTEAMVGQYIPIVVDLSEVADSEVAPGWEATESGVVVNVTVIGTGTDVSFGVSTISFYDTKADFEVNDTVVLGCVDSVTGDVTLTTLDAACREAMYDPNGTSIDLTITVRAMTPNIWKLNPMMLKTDNTTGWLPQGDERVVKRTEIDGRAYGYIEVPDISDEECGFVRVAIPDKCNVTIGAMERLSVPEAVALSPRQYIVLEGGRILVHASLIGETIEVNYPRSTTNMQVYRGNDTYVNTVRARVAVPFTQDDGVRGVIVYPNAKITTFPVSFTNNADGAFDVVFSIKPDMNDDWYFVSRENVRSF